MAPRLLPPGLSPLDFDEFEFDPALLPVDDVDIEEELDEAFMQSLDICARHNEPRAFCACNFPEAKP